jgi:hypothetical protein
MGWHDLQRDLKKSHLQHLPPCLHPQTCWVPSTDSLILLCVGGLLISMVEFGSNRVDARCICCENVRGDEFCVLCF